MPISDIDIGQNVQRARYLRGMTQAELARSIGLDRTAVSRIEAGTRSLIATELALLAEVLAVSVQDLLQATPALTRSTNLTRMLMRSGPVASNDEPQLAWFVDLIERAARVAPRSVLPKLRNRLLALAAPAAGELGARSVRRQMGLGLTAPVTDLSALLARFGVLITTARFPSASRVAGCGVTLPNGLSAILVNANHYIARQRFTVCHELAHLLFDADGDISACDAGEIRPGPRSRAELRAEAFAAAFLLPKRALAPLGWLTMDLSRLHALEAEYGVSHGAAVHRLRELGMIAEDEARVVRKLAGPPQPARDAPPFRLVGETLAQLVENEGARRNGDQHGYEVVPDSAIIP